MTPLCSGERGALHGVSRRLHASSLAASVSQCVHATAAFFSPQVPTELNTHGIQSKRRNLK